MRIKKLSVFVVVVALLAVFYAGADLSADEAKKPVEVKSDLPPDIQRIKDRGKLIVALVNDTVAPFFYEENGKLTGLDPSLARDIAEQMGVEVEFNRSSDTWDGTVELVENGEADVVISLVSNSLSRSTRVAFSDPYVTLNDGLLINRLKLAKFEDAEEDILKMLTTQDYKMGVITGRSHVEVAAADYPNAEIVIYDSFDDVIAAVTKGDVLAFLSDEIDVRIWAEENPEGSLNILSFLRKDKHDTIAFVVNWRDTHLLSWLNLYLDTIRLNGKMDELIGKYMEWKLEK